LLALEKLDEALNAYEEALNRDSTNRNAQNGKHKVSKVLKHLKEQTHD
jgi:hypothetical protein